MCLGSRPHPIPMCHQLKANIISCSVRDFNSCFGCSTSFLALWAMLTSHVLVPLVPLLGVLSPSLLIWFPLSLWLSPPYSFLFPPWLSATILLLWLPHCYTSFCHHQENDHQSESFTICWSVLKHSPAMLKAKNPKDTNNSGLHGPKTHFLVFSRFPNQFCAYADLTIMASTNLHSIFHYELCTWLNVSKNKKWFLEALLGEYFPTKSFKLMLTWALSLYSWTKFPLFVEP